MEGDALASMVQGLSTAACRQDLRSCLANGGGVSHLGQCTLDFEGCFTQAALDGLGQGQLLSRCRGVADDPLPVAVPKPSNLVDCTLQLTQCLAGLNNPFDCADQARACGAP